MEEPKPETQVVKPKSNKRVFIIIAIIVAGIMLLAGCVVVIAALIVAVSPKSIVTNEGPDPVSESEVYTGVIANDTPECSLPVVKFEESAFSIGVPNGWIYEVDGGTVSIMQDASNTTAAFLYTAKLDQSLSAGEFIGLFKEIFTKTVTSAGGTFTLDNIETGTDSARGNINASLDGVEMTGTMQVEKTQDFVTLRSYWAPVSALEVEEPVLKEITNCFARQRIIDQSMLSAVENKDQPKEEAVPGGFQAFKGRYFALTKPANFTVTGETDSGIDLTRTDGNAGFSYAYATGAVGSYTPQTWAERALPQYAKVQNISLGAGRNIPSPINGQTVSEFEFSGMLNGSVPVKGKITVGIINNPYFGIGSKSFSAFWGIQIATPDAWNGAKTTLQTIQDSLQITDIGNTRKNVLLPPNRPIESVGGSSITSKSKSYSDTLDKSSEEKWSDAMRGYETVTSPSTGDSYDVPQNSWSSYGPEGPGYYRQLPNDSLEKLQ